MEALQLKTVNCILRYHDLPGDDVPILFIHGLGCAGSFDYPQVAGQPELQNHRRILVDLLGAGFSDKPDDFDYSVASHGVCLLELVEALGLNRFVLYGHSLGGAVALSLASLCRDRVEKIILSESNLDSGGGFISMIIGGYTLEAFMHEGFQKLISESRSNGNHMWAASLSLWSPKAAYGLSISAIIGQTPTWRDILYSLTCPRTYIFGERSLPDPDQVLLAEQGLSIEIVENAGHSMAWENPQGLAKTIWNGLNRHSDMRLKV